MERELKRRPMPGNLPMRAYQMKHLAELRRERLATKRCFARDSTCTSIIEAHSIAVHSLERISESGQVYVFQQAVAEGLEALYRYRVHHPVLQPISKVSTFTGFCGKHDNELFAVIDNERIAPTDDQGRRIFFRTLARNYFDAVRGPQMVDRILKADLPSGLDKRREKQFVAEQAERSLSGKEEVHRHLDQARNEVSKGAGNGLNQLLLRLSEVPNVMCSDLYVPLADFQGRPLRPSSSARTQFLSVNISSDTVGGYVHLSWKPGMEVVEAYVDSWKRTSYNLSKMYCMIFSYMGNFAFKPSWWDTQSIMRKKRLMEYYIHPYFTYEIRDIQAQNAAAVAADHRAYTSIEVVEAIATGPSAHA